VAEIRVSDKKHFPAIKALDFFRWFRRLVNFQNVLVSFFFSVKIGWTIFKKVALDSDVFVAYFDVLPLFFSQHFLAVNALDRVFFHVDLSDVFLFVLLGKERKCCS